jgi:hypothetical protein
MTDHGGSGADLVDVSDTNEKVVPSAEHTVHAPDFIIL